MICVELRPQLRRRRAAFASGHTYAPECVVQLVEENVESFCLDRRNGSHGSTGRDTPVRVVQYRRQVFGDSAIQAKDDLLAHMTNST
jgi:hypothetical protein